MVRRLMRGGHECVAHDLNGDAVARLSNEGARGVLSLRELVATLRKPRIAWLMVPAASVGQVVEELSRRFEPDDINEGVPAHVMSAALYERFGSRGQADFAERLLAARRYQFGGHIESTRLPTPGGLQGHD